MEPATHTIHYHHLYNDLIHYLILHISLLLTQDLQLLSRIITGAFSVPNLVQRTTTLEILKFFSWPGGDLKFPLPQYLEPVRRLFLSMKGTCWLKQYFQGWQDSLSLMKLSQLIDDKHRRKWIFKETSVPVQNFGVSGLFFGLYGVMNIHNFKL